MTAEKFNLVVEHGADQFPLRLPDGYRERIKAAAKANGRSMNAEMLYRLLAYDRVTQPEQATTRLDAVEAKLDRIISLLDLTPTSGGAGGKTFMVVR